MKNRERFFCLLTLTLVILGLLAGCGSKDSDVQDPDGIIYEYDSIGAGSIMQNGEQIEVLFFYDQETVYMFEPDESQLGEDDGHGDLIPDEGNAVPVLMGGALPFTNMETQQSETHEDGTYYYAAVAEDGWVMVVNTVMQRHWEYDVQTLEEYIGACALTLCGSDTYDSLNVEQNTEYYEKMSYPVYIVTYVSGGYEDAREWTVFAMDTDSYTYLYGLGVTSDAPDDLKLVYQDIFAGLNLTDGE